MYKKSINAMVPIVHVCDCARGMQRSPYFYEMLLKTYTNKRDVVLLYVEASTLAKKTIQHERHLKIIDHNEVLTDLLALGGC